MKLAVIIPIVAPAFVAKNALRPFSKIDGREVFLRTIELYTPRNHIAQRIVVVRPDDMEEMRDRFSSHLGFQGVTVAGGGSEWFGCVQQALEKLHDDIDTVLIHDGCCPAVPFTLLDALEDGLAAAKEVAGVVPVLPSRSAFADLDGLRVAEYVEMSAVSEVQSPQIFRRAPLVNAYAQREGKAAMDDAELLVLSGQRIATLAGSRFNMRMDSDEVVRLGKDLLNHLPKPKSKTPLNPFGEAEW
ncbi:MAG TPA: 2-C-methyl-D-erythritol 4-phosphate cytidylyltransferase [Phycisphaerae bacterium]|nr:2-C-methyl-D-erythritol 4-phosphate cytidylyltransferase [Phycisphaerae bacterium]